MDHLGYGVFETILVRGGPPTVIALDQHLARLAIGAAALGIKLPKIETIKAALIKQVLAQDFSKVPDLVARIIAGPQKLRIELQPWKAQLAYSGIKLISVVGERPVPQLKHSSSLVSVLARKKAVQKKVDEALLLDRGGRVLEGAWSNFFWINKSGQVFTTKDGVLPGITRAQVLALRDVKLVPAPLLSELLLDLQAAFITQATHGVVPVIRLDTRELPESWPNPWIAKLIKDYQGLAKPLV